MCMFWCAWNLLLNRKVLAHYDTASFKYPSPLSFMGRQRGQVGARSEEGELKRQITWLQLTHLFVDTKVTHLGYPEITENSSIGTNARQAISKSLREVWNNISFKKRKVAHYCHRIIRKPSNWVIGRNNVISIFEVFLLTIISFILLKLPNY